MSQVAVVRWYDKEGKQVHAENMGGSCLACLYLGRHKVPASFMEILFAEDDYDEGNDYADWSKDATRTDWNIPWQDWGHPLIQALVPGIESAGNSCVRVPLEGIPFDQIICALRIIREFKDFAQFREEMLYSGSFMDDDYYPCVASVNEKILKGILERKGVDRFSRNTTPAYIIDSYSTRDNFKAYIGLTREDAITQALDRLEKGIINPGWHPEWNKGFGYVKSHESVPQEFMDYPLPKGDHHPHRVIQAALQAYKKKHGKYPHFSIDHPLCVYQGGHIED